MYNYLYLGVTISSDLRWHGHVHNISVKATRVLNFVRRNTYHCTPEVKVLAYTSLIRPHLEYASAAWDHYTARDSHHLDKLQRPSGISTICQKRLQADHISFRTYLSVRMAVTSRTQEKCSSVPVLQGSTWTGMNFSILQDAPDTVKLIHLLLCHPTLTPTSFHFSQGPRTVTDWNALPASARAKQSTDAFKKALHKFPDTPADRCSAVPLQQ